MGGAPAAHSSFWRSLCEREIIQKFSSKLIALRAERMGVAFGEKSFKIASKSSRIGALKGGKIVQTEGNQARLNC